MQNKIIKFGDIEVNPSNIYNISLRHHNVVFFVAKNKTKTRNIINIRQIGILINMIFEKKTLQSDVLSADEHVSLLFRMSYYIKSINFE